MKRGRNGRIHHCDCCYCEVFGHSNNESLKFGRAPQIRERLRLKLKKRSGKEVVFHLSLVSLLLCS